MNERSGSMGTVVLPIRPSREPLEQNRKRDSSRTGIYSRGCRSYTFEGNWFAGGLTRIRRLAGMVCIVIVIIAGVGHSVQDMRLASWSSGQRIDMKQTTVLMLLIAGVMSVLMTTAPRSRLREVAIYSLASLIGGILLAQVLWYGRAPNPAVHEAATTVGNMQSLGTLVGLSLLALSGWIRGVGDHVVAAVVLSRIAGLIGGIALIGYVVNWPSLYWHYSHVSNPMAIPTAVCLCLCSFAVNGLERKNQQ